MIELTNKQQIEKNLITEVITKINTLITNKIFAREIMIFNFLPIIYI